MSDKLCHHGNPTIARCTWPMTRNVAAADDDQTAYLDRYGHRYRQVPDGTICCLRLCAEYANRVPGGALLCLWHFTIGKEQGVVPADAPPASPHRRYEEVVHAAHR